LGAAKLKLERALAQSDRAGLLDSGEKIANITGESERGGRNRG
jgi:hypothetical protein